jgi:hypothetical protein
MMAMREQATVAAPAVDGGREYRLAVGGLPYFGRKMAALLSGEGWQAAYLETRGWRPAPALRALRRARRADALYQLGGQIARLSRPNALLAVARRPCVMHWTGSDVLFARKVAERGAVAERLRRGCIHWAGAPWLVDELATFGVRADWVPHSAVAAPERIPELPDGPFTVLAYLRAGREAFYGAGAVCRAAATLPEAVVLVVGCARLDGAPANVRCLGWIAEMAPVYARCHALLRMTEHDGLAFMVQEALAFGRHAVWNHPFPGAVEAASAAAACDRLKELAGRHRAGTLAPNLDGAAHVHARYNPDRIRDDIRRRLAAVIEARA